MEYFVIDLHDTLLRNELGDDSPYVTVGVQFRPHMPHDIPEVPLHYSGNFWMPSVPSSIHCPHRCVGPQQPLPRGVLAGQRTRV